jgi:long-chain acyl-CoA synthetase
MVKYKATAFHGVATMYHAIMSHPDLESYAEKINLRYAVTGAAPTPEPVFNAWNEKFTGMCEGYGLTEATTVVTMNPLTGKGLQKPGSIGFPVAKEIDINAVDSEGNTVKPGEIGEIVVRGNSVMNGYWENPKATEETIINGWLYTGDLGYFDEDGYFYIKDRSKDMILTGGFNIYPKEIEDFLYTHPAVNEVQEVGMGHKEKGEIAVACIVLRPGMSATEEDIVKYCRENMAAYKKPRKVIFLDELPKTAAGKHEKVSLRQMLKQEENFEG